jgi:hypothetical protein
MYQRYYKQRRFGRIFSFFLVVGSGLSHYVKSGYRFIKDTISIEYITKYSDHLPDDIGVVLDKLKGKTNYLAFDIENKKKFFIYEENLNKLKNGKTTPRFSESFDDTRNKETYYKYTKYKSFL